MLKDFYKKFYKVIYERFVLAFFILLVLVISVLFLIVNIFLLKKEIDIGKTEEKSIQERFLNIYDIVEKNKKGTEFPGFLIDFFNLRR
jgi:competence protein ComGC